MSEKRILVVGCGGLGCELAKLLAMDPANKLTLVDNDTISHTNLNRQFLFTSTDVGKPKAQVVCEKLKLGEYVVGKIDQFKRIEFYKQFDMVYNCLDNDEARSFVNQRCYAAGVKMVDGGSAGWLGQAFYNGKECFDCLPKRTEKVYPVCSVRNKPENFEHCLIWAKTVVAEKNRESLEEELKAEAPESEDAIDTHEAELEPRKRPRLVDLDASDDADVVNSRSPATTGQVPTATTGQVPAATTGQVPAATTGQVPTATTGQVEVPTAADLVAAHLDTISSNQETERCVDPEEAASLYRRLSDTEDDRTGLIYDLAIIKAQRFKIKPMSLLDSETFLDKIIPSICTTNAVIASLMVISGSKQRNFFLVQGSQMILNTDLNGRNPDCLVCSLPVYLVKCQRKHSVGELLRQFRAESLISEAGFYDTHSDLSLGEFDGTFLISVKNETKNRMYFEVGESGALRIERIK